MRREEVELVLPGVLFGGDFRGLLDYLGLEGRSLGNNRWAVWPNNDKVFISHYGLADDTEFVNRFDHLKNMPLTSPHLDDPEIVARLAEIDKQLAERMSGGSDITALFHSIQASECAGGAVCGDSPGSSGGGDVDSGAG